MLFELEREYEKKNHLPGKALAPPVLREARDQFKAADLAFKRFLRSLTACNEVAKPTGNGDKAEDKEPKKPRKRGKESKKTAKVKDKAISSGSGSAAAQFVNVTDMLEYRNVADAVLNNAIGSLFARFLE